ncbi:hypothetical protein PR371_00670 [Mycobacterium marinum]|uniref:hypothetical protein n=1 Tax=Mycobacterium marinum TaxID=1781 RepID=UPI00234125B4|nr:hypothetical protein [Mycobacterium marinum]MDC8992493.1 hypothetical protein [Mycobacterium marinum]WDZ15794.1 hypothetical protein PQR73_009705 [Mycobacterium marinum]
MGFRELMQMRIAPEQKWATAIREVARHYDVTPRDEYVAVLMSVLAGAVADLEARLIALEAENHPGGG